MKDGTAIRYLVTIVAIELAFIGFKATKVRLCWDGRICGAWVETPLGMATAYKQPGQPLVAGLWLGRGPYGPLHFAVTSDGTYQIVRPGEEKLPSRAKVGRLWPW